MKKSIITIDGSSFTGKSTVAKALANMLGYQYLNTGSMFRAIAYLKREKNFADNAIQEIITLAQNAKMDFKIIGNQSRFFVNNKDFTDIVKENELAYLASKVASIFEVREALLSQQREIAKDGGFVVEGRDTGTVVFPNADWKFYLDADLDIKIERYFKILQGDKDKYSREEVRRKILETDEKDKNRKIAPLRKADDAILYDNSHSPSAEQDAIVMWYYITGKNEIIKNNLILQKKV